MEPTFSDADRLSQVDMEPLSSYHSMSHLSQSQPRKKGCKLPQGVMFHIYSFLDLRTLIDLVSRLSSRDRRAVISDSEILSQSRCLRISICPKTPINYS